MASQLGLTDLLSFLLRRAAADNPIEPVRRKQAEVENRTQMNGSDVLEPLKADKWNKITIRCTLITCITRSTTDAHISSMRPCALQKLSAYKFNVEKHRRIPSSVDCWRTYTYQGVWYKRNTQHWPTQNGSLYWQGRRNVVSQPICSYYYWLH